MSWGGVRSVQCTSVVLRNVRTTAMIEKGWEQ